jgi:hypothetical protein
MQEQWGLPLRARCSVLLKLKLINMLFFVTEYEWLKKGGA